MRVSATRLIAVVTVLAVVIPVAFFTVSGWRSYHAYQEDVRRDLMRTLDVVREHTSSVFDTHELIAAKMDLILGDMTDEQVRASEADIHEQFKDIVNRRNKVQDLWVVDRNGAPLVSGNVFPVPRDLDVSDREYFRVFKDGQLKPGELFVSRALRGRVQDVIFFQVARERRRGPNGQFNGVDVVSVEPEYFQSFFAEVLGKGVEAVALTRADGAVLARFPHTPTPLPEAPIVTTLLKATAESPARGVIEANSPLDGVRRIAAFQKLPRLPLYVSAALSMETAVAAWRSEFLGQLIFAVPATLAMLALCLMALSLTRRETAALEQLRAESELRETAEEQLRQSQKMEAVGRLTGGVAHDFNNLLTIVIGNLDLLRRRLADADDRTLKTIENAHVGATRAATLTQRLLAFSRQQPLAPAAVDVNKLVAGMSDLLRRTLGETIAVETVLAGGLWRAHVDVNQLESALLNLAVNARDAMPEGGKLTIETANTYLDDAYVANKPDVKSGQYVMIAVADTGQGMPPDIIAKAFDPFFTTKPVGQGTGLGLSQVYGFAKQSNGHVAIYSELDHGTAVKLYLPRVIKAAEEAAEPSVSTAGVQAGGNETILVVEDDEMVRAFTVEALRDAGYTVVQAEDARPALGLLRAHPEIALLFTDVVLGGMNGRQLADEAAKIRPGLPILFTTGYTQNAIVHQGKLDEGINFIGKPFSAGALVAKVQAVLKR